MANDKKVTELRPGMALAGAAAGSYALGEEYYKTMLEKREGLLSRYLWLPLTRVGNGVKRVTVELFRALIVLLLTSGILMMYFSWQAYNGNSTPFETIYMMQLNDNMKDISKAVANIQDNDIALRMDAAEESMLNFHNKLKAVQGQLKNIKK